MAAATRTVRVRFDGTTAGLAAAAAKAKAQVKAVEDGVARSADRLRSFGTAAALIVPAVGHTAGALVGLTGVLGVLPGVAFSAGLGVGALALGMRGFGKAMENIGDPEKFGAAIAKLAPSARATALAIRDLFPQLWALKTAVQDKLFAGMDRQVKALTAALLPMLRTQLVATAGSINSAGVAFALWARNPATVRDLNAALGGSRGLLDGMLRAVQPLSAAMLHLGVVAAPYLQKLGDYLAGAATRLEAFTRTARESGDLAQWIGAGVETFQSFGRVIESLLASVVNLGAAFTEAGLPSVLEMIASGIEKVTGFIREHSDVMVPLINTIGLLVLAYKGLMFINSLVTAITALNSITWLSTVASQAASAAQWLWNYAMLANPAGWVVIAILALIAAIAACVIWWPELSAAATAAVDWIAARWDGFVAWLSGKWEEMKAVAAAKWEQFKTWIGLKVDQVLAKIDWFASIPGRVAAWFGSMTQAAIVKAGQLVAWLAGLPGRILGAVGSLATTLLGAGKDLVTGLWNGIKAKWTWLTEKVKGLARSALTAAKSALGIRSPSKVFREQVGRFIPEGIAVGISANTAQVTAAARDLSAAATRAAAPTARIAADAAAAPLVGVRVGAPASAPNVAVSVTLDGRELAGMVRTEIDEANRRVRRQVHAGRGM